MCTAEWGKVMTERLQLLETWAERQGLELAADCHLAKINQCAQFLQVCFGLGKNYNVTLVTYQVRGSWCSS